MTQPLSSSIFTILAATEPSVEILVARNCSCDLIKFSRTSRLTLFGSNPMSTPEIRAMTFDVGGTLIQPSPSVGHVYAEVAGRHGHNSLNVADLDQRFRDAWHARGHFDHTREAWGGIVDEVFSGLLPKPPGEAFFQELYEEFASPSAWEIFNDTIPALEELADRGIPMAIVSNWDERLRPLLDSLDLSGYFDAILISCEIYFTKPSTVIFEHALRSLGVPAESVLHVGDSVAEDVDGAQAAGLQAVLIDRTQPKQPGQIMSLTEIADLLPALR